MRFASSLLPVGLLCAGLQLSCAPPESPPLSKPRASSAAAGQGAAAVRGPVLTNAAVSGGAAEVPYVGDVPARAASSGNTPCGSSEFSVGPCGGRPAAAPSQADAGSAEPKQADAGRAQTTPEDAGNAGPQHTLAGLTSEGCDVIALPDSVRASYQLDPFYTRYASAGGIPIVGSDKPQARTLHLACLLVNEMLSERFDVREALLESKVTFAIVATSEKTTEIPEYRDLPDYYDMRARGLGGHTGLCAEENILCDRHNDRWHGESICVHEYSHTIAIYGLFSVDATFEDRLAAAYSSAANKGLWRDTFAAQDAQEYWAEGVQDWYDTNLEADPADGVHNAVNTRGELEAYDPALYKLIDELLPSDTRWPDCYRD